MANTITITTTNVSWTTSTLQGRGYTVAATGNPDQLLVTVSSGTVCDISGDSAHRYITSVDSFDFPSLTGFNCGYNQLASLPSLTGLTALQYLYCQSNQLTALPSLTGLTALHSLWCFYNQLTQLPDLTGLTALRFLHCNSNQLTQLPDLTGLINLQMFDCQHNLLTQLPDLTGLPIQSLACGYNQLTSLPTLPAVLLYLRCEYNQLTSLPSLTGLTAFSFLDCQFNQLTSVQIDLIYSTINSYNTSDGFIYTRYNAGDVTNNSLTARNQLTSRNWTLLFGEEVSSSSISSSSSNSSSSNSSSSSSSNSSSSSSLSSSSSSSSPSSLSSSSSSSKSSLSSSSSIIKWSTSSLSSLSISSSSKSESSSLSSSSKSSESLDESASSQSEFNFINLNVYNTYAYFSFNEISGTRIDCVNNVQLYEIDGEVFSSIGKRNNAALFRSNGYLICDARYFSEVSTKSTIFNIWFMLEDNNVNFTGLNDRIIMESQYNYGIYLGDFNKLHVAINNVEFHLSSLPVLRNNIWYNICLLISSGQSYLSVASQDGKFLFPLNVNYHFHYHYSDVVFGKNICGRISDLAIIIPENTISLYDFNSIRMNLYQNGEGLFYSCGDKLWEINTDVNDVLTKTPLLTTPISNQVISLKSIYTAWFNNGVKYLMAQGSENRSTTERIHASSLSFGNIAAGGTSQTLIIKLEAPSTLAIQNIKIGLIYDEKIGVGNNIFGIGVEKFYDEGYIPSVYFQGISTGENSVFNISVPNSSQKASYYVYLNMVLPAGFDFLRGTIRYKWYFDYA